MLNNKWIISDKERVTSRPEYLYTLLLVDCDPRLYKTECQHICSTKDLYIGAMVDCDLNPLTNHYKPEHSDIATVEFVNTYNVGSKDLRTFSFFSDSMGCFDAFISKKHQEFQVKRGDEISVFMRKDPLNPLNIDKKPDYFVFKMMQNLTTGEKSPKFKYIIDNYNGVFENIVIVGIDATGTKDAPAKKSILINSPRYGHILSTVLSNEPLFFTRHNDKLLIEQKIQNNCFEILQNITADNIRKEFLLNQR